jgi:hypothetical protein
MNRISWHHFTSAVCTNLTYSADTIKFHLQEMQQFLQNSELKIYKTLLGEFNFGMHE